MNEQKLIEDYQSKGWTLSVYPNYKRIGKGLEGIVIYPDRSISTSSPAGTKKYATLQDWIDKKPSSVKEYGGLD